MPPKHCHLSAELHGVTFRKNAVVIFTAANNCKTHWCARNNMKSTTVWHMTPCTFVEVCWRFGRTWYFYLRLQYVKSLTLLNWQLGKHISAKICYISIRIHGVMFHNMAFFLLSSLHHQTSSHEVVLLNLRRISFTQRDILLFVQLWWLRCSAVEECLHCLWGRNSKLEMLPQPHHVLLLVTTTLSIIPSSPSATNPLLAKVAAKKNSLPSTLYDAAA